jgi:hypothetical protein
MLDRDLAALYGVETKNLNKAVRRNLDRFPADFMFQLTLDEALVCDASRFQFGTLKRGEHVKQECRSRLGEAFASRIVPATLGGELKRWAGSWRGMGGLKSAESGRRLASRLHPETAVEHLRVPAFGRPQSISISAT